MVKILPIVLVAALSLACAATLDEPELNKNLLAEPIASLEYVTYIPVHDRDLSQMLINIDKWVAAHQTCSISVDVVNATEKDTNDGQTSVGYTLPSGAILIATKCDE